MLCLILGVQDAPLRSRCSWFWYYGCVYRIQTNMIRKLSQDQMGQITQMLFEIPGQSNTNFKSVLAAAVEAAWKHAPDNDAYYLLVT